MKKETISLYTLGCRTNQSETASIQKSFEDFGFDVVDVECPANYSIINTCTVTAKGDTDTRKMVHKLCRINPDVQIALIGCQAEIQKEQLLKFPNVKWVVGTEKKMEIADLIKNGMESNASQVVISPIQKKSFKLSLQSIHTNHTRANIKIQDGCDSFCSYCEVPYARGRARSRVFSDILKEAKNLSSAGFQEVIITGINIGKYSYEGKKLVDVIDAIEQINAIKRIRISSIEFKTISNKLINKIKNGSKLCRYLHMPLQSASDDILKKMNRKYSFTEFKHFINNVHTAIPNICLGSDVIVGFPQETDRLFEQTKNRLQLLPLTYLHVFSYSPRNLAISKNFANPVNPREISQRSQILRKLSLEKRIGYLQSQLGSVQEVLFEQQKGGYWSGLTETYIRVKIKSSENLSNVFKKVELRKIEGQAIVGKFQK